MTKLFGSKNILHEFPSKRWHACGFTAC